MGVTEANSRLSWADMSITTHYDRLEEWRPPPPEPTRVSFPALDFLPDVSSTWVRGSVPDLFRLYGGIRNSADVSIQHLMVLNLSFHEINESCSADLFPSDRVAGMFLPPTSWLSSIAVAANLETRARLLRNGRPFPSWQEFDVRCNELRHANEDAYRALTGRAKEEVHLPRLAHFRRFWEGLDNMACYWDVASDHYIAVSPESHRLVSGAISIGIRLGRSAVITRNPREEGAASVQSTLSSNDLESSIGTIAQTAGHQDMRVCKESLLVEPSLTRYRGNRIGNGAGMPDIYRTDAILAFVQPIAWSFGFTIAAHRKPTVVELRSLLIPITLSGTVWRPPDDRHKARAGFLEGPVLGISCRNEVEFAQGKADPVHDCLMEIGAMLCLAQERAREGIAETQPGKGRWWTSTPRWGGGIGGEMGEAVAAGNNSDDHTVGNDLLDQGSRAERPARSKRKQAAATAWKTLRAGVGLWDSKVEYTAIGKVAGSEWDNVGSSHGHILLNCIG